MRKFYSFFLAVLITAIGYAQAPQKMSYQAVIRNSSDGLVTNHVVGMRISILKDATPVYIETQTTTTNSNGLATIEIGGGTPVTGTFEGIDWSIGTYFIKTETDPAGGTTYTITGTSQLLSVPYALYAEKAGNGFSGNYNDLINTPSLSPIARTGSYNDLINKPVLFDGTWNSVTGKPALSLVATSGSYGDLNNKPTTDGSETKVLAGTNISIAGTGTTSNPYIVNSTLSGTSIQGTKIGDMQFWNGEVWVIVPVGQPGQVLKISSSGEPYWSGSKLATLS